MSTRQIYFWVLFLVSVTLSVVSYYKGRTDTIREYEKQISILEKKLQDQTKVLESSMQEWARKYEDLKTENAQKDNEKWKEENKKEAVSKSLDKSTVKYINSLL